MQTIVLQGNSSIVGTYSTILNFNCKSFFRFKRLLNCFVFGSRVCSASNRSLAVMARRRAPGNEIYRYRQKGAALLFFVAFFLFYLSPKQTSRSQYSIS